MAASTSFTGVFPILITPFDDDENLDLASFEKVVRFMVEIGVDGITILGVLGEANRLIDAEREQLILTAIQAADGAIPVVVGTSHTGTRAALQLSQMAESLGASGIMLTPGHEPVPNEERIFEYFQQVAAGISIPIVAQDHPASTQVHMSPSLLLRLVREIPQVACIKEEATPTPPKIRALRAGMQDRKVSILTGLGALYGQFDLESGADGFMTGFALPEVLKALVEGENKNREEEMRALYTRFLPLIVFEQQPGLAVRKEIYRRRGLIVSNRVRHPGASILPEAATQLQSIVDQVLPNIDITRPLVP
jgi:4-hydroxy-tetrahydrodipicolinate synthase